MIDNVPIIIDIKLPNNFWNYNKKKKYLKREFKGYEFLPMFNSRTKEVTKFYRDFDNLRFEILRGDRLKISNSWHKLLKGNNYSDFTYSNLIDSIQIIESILDISLRKAKILKLEYGVNLDFVPVLVYNSWLSLRTKNFKTIEANNKIYGRKFDLTDYSIKCYNKLLVAKKLKEILDEDLDMIPDDITRIEVKVKHMKHLHKRKKPLPIVTVSDLMKKDNLVMLGEDLIEKYSNIKKVILPDFEDLTPCDIGMYSAMNDAEKRDYLKNRRPDTFKNYNKKMNRWKDTYDTNFSTKVEIALARKWEYLLSN